ncbi:MAG: M48 family metallopeptidase [Candidatus Sumerlaeota bacterium]|nr:M48 family metallopeptidase [Candidatus Sumerlaeota bacterium]
MEKMPSARLVWIFFAFLIVAVIVYTVAITQMQPPIVREVPIVLRPSPPAKKIPKALKAEDYARPLDRETLAKLEWLQEKADRWGTIDWLDSRVLKPYFDDVNTAIFNIHGVEIRKNQFRNARVDWGAIIQECAKIMHLEKPPRAYVINDPSCNIFTTNFQDPILVIHAGLIRCYEDPDEIRFVVGHEMGHIALNHVRWTTLVRLIVEKVQSKAEFLPDSAKFLPFLPIFKWFREAEMSADAAGLICCQNPGAAERALVRLNLGMAGQSLGELNVEEYMAQNREKDLSAFSEKVLLMQALAQDHPFIYSRIEELRKYAKSDKYTQLYK